MKDFNTYIIEKIKIDKDTKLYKQDKAFDSMEECFDYIKYSSKEYKFEYKIYDHWAYVYKNHIDTYPMVKFCYSRNHINSSDELFTTEKGGKFQKDYIILIEDEEKYKYIDYTDKGFILKDNGFPNPSIKFIDYIFKELNKLK